MTEKISTIHDTAAWAVAGRFHETCRQDALFRDPWAERWIADLPQWALRPNPIVVARTHLMDCCVYQAVSEGVSTIINLAAGFDMRPYRMELPEHLRWIELDFAEVFEQKNTAISETHAVPSCLVQQHEMDIRQGDVLGAFLEEEVKGVSALVITEGLLIYLTQSEVDGLCQTLGAIPNLDWVVDFAGKLQLQELQQKFNPRLPSSPMQFAPPVGLEYFAKFGWKCRLYASFLDAVWKLKRDRSLRQQVLQALKPYMSSQRRARLFNEFGVAWLTQHSG
jgi:methyltransferase (TIGR00027 family)